jgi:hypothetical protein
MSQHPKLATYQRLKADRKLLGTIKAALAKRQQRDELKQFRDPLTTTLATRRSSNTNTIPLGNSTEINAIEQRVRAEWPRLRAWDGIEATYQQTRKITRTTYPYKGNHRNHAKNTNTVAIQSYGVACGRVLFFHFEGTQQTIKAPRGYRWSIDQNGIKLVDRFGNDHHPLASELLQGTKFIVGILKQNLATRKLQQADQKKQLRFLRSAVRQGAAVIPTDSVRAGNCRAGTLNWLQRNNLTTQKWLPVTDLQQQAAQDRRVVLVVAAALRRHRADIARGYCQLADRQFA